MLDRRLGQSSLQIPPVVFGAWAIGGGDWSFAWGPQDDTESVAAIHASIDAGVASFDTAPIYGFGHSEQVLGRALAGRTGRGAGLHQGGPALGRRPRQPLLPDGGPRRQARPSLPDLRPDSIRTELRQPGPPGPAGHRPAADPRRTSTGGEPGAMARLVRRARCGPSGSAISMWRACAAARASLADRGLPWPATSPAIR